MADAGNGSEDVPVESCFIILTGYLEFALKNRFYPLP